MPHEIQHNVSDKTEPDAIFGLINDHRKAIAIITQPFDDKIKTIDDKIDLMIAEKMEERKILAKKSSDAIQGHDQAIEKLSELIRTKVIDRKESCKTEYGTCILVKGTEGKVTWDDAALGVVIDAAKGELDYLKKYRSKDKDKDPHTRFKLATMK